MKETIRTLINNIIMKPVTDNEDLINTGLLDSVSIVELLMTIEKKFHIEVSLADITPSNFSTLNTIENFINDKARRTSVN